MSDNCSVFRRWTNPVWRWGHSLPRRLIHRSELIHPEKRGNPLNSMQSACSKNGSHCSWLILVRWAEDVKTISPWFSSSAVTSANKNTPSVNLCFAKYLKAMVSSEKQLWKNLSGKVYTFFLKWIPSWKYTRHIFSVHTACTSRMLCRGGKRQLSFRWMCSAYPAVRFQQRRGILHCLLKPLALWKNGCRKIKKISVILGTSFPHFDQFYKLYVFEHGVWG